MKSQIISTELGEVLRGNRKLDGTLQRLDGTYVFYLTNDNGEQVKIATERPPKDLDAIKKRWKNIHGLDPDYGTLIPNALHIDNDELAIRMESSAYWEILWATPLIVTPSMFLSCAIARVTPRVLYRGDP